MASALYPDYKESCLGGGAHSFSDLSAGGDTINCALVDTSADYTYSAGHQDYDDIGAYTINAGYGGEANQPLSNRSVTAGVFDNGQNLTFTGVDIVSGKTVDALVHYKDSGVIGTSPLICYHDEFTAVTPNGGDITIAYNGSGLFAL